jgi:hypothetical protein
LKHGPATLLRNSLAGFNTGPQSLMVNQPGIRLDLQPQRLVFTVHQITAILFHFLYIILDNN